MRLIWKKSENQKWSGAQQSKCNLEDRKITNYLIFIGSHASISIHGCIICAGVRYAVHLLFKVSVGLVSGLDHRSCIGTTDSSFSAYREHYSAYKHEVIKYNII